jgi:hypothetical protein
MKTSGNDANGGGAVLVDPSPLFFFCAILGRQLCDKETLLVNIRAAFLMTA